MRGKRHEGLNIRIIRHVMYTPLVKQKKRFVFLCFSDESKRFVFGLVVFEKKIKQ